MDINQQYVKIAEEIKKIEPNFDMKEFDIQELDSNLEFSENLKMALEKLEMRKKEKLTKAKIESLAEKDKIDYEEFKSEHKEEYGLNKIFTEPSNVLIIGKKGSAKSSWAWSFVEQAHKLSGRKIYTFRFPRPELLKGLPFEVNNLTNMKQLFNLTDGICLIDEAHRFFDVLNKSVNEDLKLILANSRQNNCSFAFITHNSYFITRGLFTYIDVKIIKEVNEGHWDTERPHMKKLYSDTNIEGESWFFIDSDYYRGRERFEKPVWFTEELSKAFRNTNAETKTFFEKVRETAERCGVMRNENFSEREDR